MMKRRRYITVSGIAVLTALSGCNGTEEGVEGSREVSGDTSDIDGEGKVTFVYHELVREGRIATTVTVSGSVKNISGDTLGRIEVLVRFLDDSGTRVDSQKANTTKVPAGQTWSFEVQPYGVDEESITDYEIALVANF
jgi:hypothetical protein